MARDMDPLLDLLGTPAGSMTVGEFLLHLAVSFLLAQLVGWVYVSTHRGASFSRAQTQAMVMLSIIVTTVMLAVGDNMAGAFGVFGALAMIRFRTPIKDARDTTFLFLAVAIGVSVGTRNLELAVIGTVFALLVAIYLTSVRFGSPLGHDGLLRLRLGDGTAPDDRLERVLLAHCSSHSLLHVRDSGEDLEREAAYRLQLYDPDNTTALLDAVRSVRGIGGVSLLMQQHDEEP